MNLVLNSTKHLKNLYKFFPKSSPQNIRSILPNSFYETSITVIPKPGKEIIIKESYSPVSQINVDVEVLNKMLAKQI